MPDTLASILAAKDDADVCSGLFNLLVAHYGESFDPAAIPEEHRTVLLVWHPKGIISTTGFTGFSATDLPGDPQSLHMRAAYSRSVACRPTPPSSVFSMSSWAARRQPTTGPGCRRSAGPTTRSTGH